MLIILKMMMQEQSARQANVRAGIDFPETVHNFLSNRPLELVNLVLQVRPSNNLNNSNIFSSQADRDNFSRQMPDLVTRISAELTALSLHCFTDGRDSLERVVQDR